MMTAGQRECWQMMTNEIELQLPAPPAKLQSPTASACKELSLPLKERVPPHTEPRQSPMSNSGGHSTKKVAIGLALHQCHG